MSKEVPKNPTESNDSRWCYTEGKSLPKKLRLNNHDYSRWSLFVGLFVTT